MQNLRGQFKSEGVFLLTSQYDPKDPKQANETNDAYDTVDWLVKNVPNNNGKVGIYGISYDGLTAGLTLLHPHPALKAISEQASPVDQWMNDDDHRYGALRESYAFEYAVMEQADKNQNTHFDFDKYDTYDWYLNAGPLTNLNDRYVHGAIPYWNDVMKHPDYDAFWRKEAWVNQLHSSTVPNLNVSGFWDQEDPWGPWQIFRHAQQHDPDNTNFMVAGPWYHGGWAAQNRRQHRPRLLWRTPDRARVPAKHRSSFLSLLPSRRGRQAGVEGQHLPDRIEYLAHLRRLAAEAVEAHQPLSARRRNPVVLAPAVARHAGVSPIRF